MAYRRKRRNRGTWLPLDPTVFLDGQQPASLFETTVGTGLEPGANGAPGQLSAVTVVPIAFDITRQTPANVVGNDLTMKDITEGQDYFLDRIVGKTWAELEPSADLENRVIEVILCHAIAVLPVEDDGTTVALDQQDFAPLAAQNTMAPFAWRRTWKLYAAGSIGGNLVNVDSPPPQTIAQYGSVMDGGHIDAKTRRRIRQNQRLFFISQNFISATVGEPGTNDAITFGFDLRLHGALRRNKNRSVFS